MAELRKSFRPEFLNRIDETILFKPLTLEELTSVVDLLLVDLNKRRADRRVTVALDKKAHAWVAEKGYDPVFDARPLKRSLQRNVETKLARSLIAGEIGEGSTITFTEFFHRPLADDGYVLICEQMEDFTLTEKSLPPSFFHGTSGEEIHSAVWFSGRLDRRLRSDPLDGSRRALSGS